MKENQQTTPAKYTVNAAVKKTPCKNNFRKVPVEDDEVQDTDESNP